MAIIWLYFNDRLGVSYSLDESLMRLYIGTAETFEIINFGS